MNLENTRASVQSIDIRRALPRQAYGNGRVTGLLWYYVRALDMSLHSG